MFAVLIHIRPIDPRTNARVDVRVGSTPSSTHQGMGGQFWEAAITRRPNASLEIFGLNLEPGTRSGSADFEINVGEITAVDARPLDWKGAPVTIYRVDDLRWPGTIEFDGYVVSTNPDLDNDTLQLTCRNKIVGYDAPMLRLEFDDTGYTFDADKRTTPLPAGFGLCPNIEPVLFDSVRNFYMVDGYQNLVDVLVVREGLSSMGPRFSNYGTYAQLKAAADANQIPPGRWVSCISEGIIGLGAPPVGTITCRAQFGWGTTGRMIERALKTHAQIPDTSYVFATLDALDTAVPYPAHHYQTDQIQVNALVERYAAGCNATPVITLQGKLVIVRPFGGPLIGSFKRYGASEPEVTNWKSNGALTPSWRISARAARPGRVMSTDEILYEDVLVDRGLFDPAEFYRQGNIVWLRNKSQWLYKNVLAEPGHYPPDGTAGDAWWTNMAPAPGAADLRYTDNTPIQDRQPAEAAAQITRTANLSESSIIVLMNANDRPASGQLPRNIRATLTEANYDVTMQTDWLITKSSGGVNNATIINTPGDPNRGRLTIWDLLGPGTIEISAYRGGVVTTCTLSIETKGALADKTTTDTDDIDSLAVSRPYFAQLSGSANLPDGVRTNIMSVGINKSRTDSDLSLEACIRVESSDDIRGTFHFFVGSTTIDNIPIFMNGAGGQFRVPVTLRYREFNRSSGTYTVGVAFTRAGGASNVSALGGSNLEVVEVKR